MQDLGWLKGGPKKPGVMCAGVHTRCGGQWGTCKKRSAEHARVMPSEGVCVGSNTSTS